jgi:hypothetical protein
VAYIQKDFLALNKEGIQPHINADDLFLQFYLLFLSMLRKHNAMKYKLLQDACATVPVK